MHNNNNLTFLRWIAALMVLYGHAFVFMGLAEPVFMEHMKLGPLGVTIFFSISGYLVAQSWDRDPHVLHFLVKRSLRIFPGLAVCIFLSALVLGPMLTTLSLSEYFRHPATLGYLDNLYLYTTFYLPGVFEDNRVPNAVNGSLWSLPAEFSMYLGLALFGFIRSPRWLLLSITCILMALSGLWANQVTEMLVFYRTDIRQVVICGAYFWVGAAFHQMNVSRYFSLSNVALACVLWLVLTRWPQAFMIGSWLILPFLVLAFGLASHPLLTKLNRFDYSYGIYIYAFPVQQTLALISPHMNIWLHIILASAITLVLSGLSWHFIEKKSLALKPGRKFHHGEPPAKLQP